jgi:hypothetical protein
MRILRSVIIITLPWQTNIENKAHMPASPASQARPGGRPGWQPGGKGESGRRRQTPPFRAVQEGSAPAAGVAAEAPRPRRSCPTPTNKFERQSAVAVSNARNRQGQLCTGDTEMEFDPYASLSDEMLRKKTVAYHIAGHAHWVGLKVHLLSHFLDV